MSVYCGEVNVETNGDVDIVDITSDVQDVISKSKVFVKLRINTVPV